MKNSWFDKISRARIYGAAICKNPYVDEFWKLKEIKFHWGRVVDFDARINTKDFIILIFVRQREGRKWERIFKPANFIKGFVIMDGYKKNFEGDQGRGVLETLEASLQL